MGDSGEKVYRKEYNKKKNKSATKHERKAIAAVKDDHGISKIEKYPKNSTIAHGRKMHTENDYAPQPKRERNYIRRINKMHRGKRHYGKLKDIDEQWSGATRAYRKALDNHAYNIAKGKDAKKSQDHLNKVKPIVPTTSLRRLIRPNKKWPNTTLQKRINRYRNDS